MALSPGQTFLWTWAALALVSTVGAGVYARRLGRRDSESSGALWMSMGAVLPGVCFLIEIAVRWLDSHLAIESEALAFQGFVTFWPAVVGLLLGLLLLVASAFALPPRHGPAWVEVFRATHVATWVVSAFALLKSIVGV
jgi:hypothetical protein